MFSRQQSANRDQMLQNSYKTQRLGGGFKINQVVKSIKVKKANKKFGTAKIIKQNIEVNGSESDNQDIEDLLIQHYEQLEEKTDFQPFKFVHREQNTINQQQNRPYNNQLFNDRQISTFQQQKGVVSRPYTSLLRNKQPNSNQLDDSGLLQSDLSQKQQQNFQIKRIHYNYVGFQTNQQKIVNKSLTKEDHSSNELETLVNNILVAKKPNQTPPVSARDKVKDINIVEIIVRSNSTKIHSRPQTSSQVKSLSRIQSALKTVPKLLVQPNVENEQIQLQGINRYLIQLTLGVGSYAQVKLGRDKLTDKQVAIKIYQKSRLCDPQKRQNLRREIFILKKLDHDKIVKLLNTIDTATEFYLVMEYGGHQSLRQYIKQLQSHRVAETDAKEIFRQFILALAYCHQNNVVHRDIKLENILLNDQMNIKLIDFGFSVLANQDTKLSIYCGTPTYMAPEIVSRTEYYGKPVDIWSAGVLLYAMVTGKFPFTGKTDQELYQAIKFGNFKPPKCTTACSRLISKLLKVKPMERFDVKQVSYLIKFDFQKILIDPWLVG